MLSELLANVGLVLLFVLIGGMFAAAEMALVSLREGQVRHLQSRGGRGERVSRLAQDPNRFLSAVQIGVTLFGFLSAAFGGATLADDLAPVLVSAGLPAGAAQTTALVVITVLISYASILLGELVPKRLALQRPEGAALLLAPVIDRIALLFRPVIWLLSRSSNLVLRLLGSDPEAGREQVTEEELRDLVAAHQTLGEQERQVIDEVFAAGRRRLGEVMLPRTEVDFLEAATPVEEAVRHVSSRPHSRYPVLGRSQDDVVGFVHVRDLFGAAQVDGRTTVGELAREVAVVPGTKHVLPALSEMRRAGQHLAIVLDEYGGTDGIVTLEDLVEELVGEIRDEYDVEEEPGRARGVRELPGLLNLDEVAERTDIRLPEGPYESLAGFLLAELGRLPQPGEALVFAGHRFVVTELDGRRIASVRVETLPAGGAGDDPGAAR